MHKIVAVTELGRVCGEAHHKARLSDDDVDQIRDLYEHHAISIRDIASKFECSPATIQSIIEYRSRAITPDRYKPAAERSADLFKAEARFNEKHEPRRVELLRRCIVRHGSASEAIKFLLDYYDNAISKNPA